MKTCMQCGATAFDDMDLCYQCLSPFVGAGMDFELLGGSDDIDEPCEDYAFEEFIRTGRSVQLGELTSELSRKPPPSAALRIRVQYPGQFLYDTYLAQAEGRSCVSAVRRITISSFRRPRSDGIS